MPSSNHCPSGPRLARAFMAAALCLLALAPRISLAQEGRFLVVLDVTGDKARSVQSDFQDLFRQGNHVVFGQQDFEAAGQRQGISQPDFWDDLGLMATVCNAEGFDAVVAGHMRRNGKKYVLTVYVFDGRRGETVGEFDVKLGKKPRISGSDARDIREMADTFIASTGGAVESAVARVSITVLSEPAGAVVRRDGRPLGITPFTLEVDRADTTEVWELFLESEPVGIARVDLSRDGTFTVELDGAAAAPGNGAGFAAALPLGRARPILELTAGADLTARSLDVTVAQGSGLKYTSSLYPIFRAGFAFFPLPLFSDSDALAGIALTASVGVGSLQSKIPTPPGGVVLPQGTGCAVSADGLLMDCPTSHTQFAFGGRYRWLLQERADHHKNPDGMALDFDLAYAWLQFDIDPNPTYEGHGYQTLRLGTAFGMPLGLPELRGDIAVAFNQVLSFGSEDMIANWGTSASGWGMNLGLALTYDLYAGVFVKAGYDLSYFSTTYGGTGCQDAPTCSVPSGSVATDLYNQIALHAGWRLK